MKKRYLYVLIGLVWSSVSHAGNVKGKVEPVDDNQKNLEIRLDKLEKQQSDPLFGFGDKGFFLKSKDGAHEIRFRGLIQTDGRLFVDLPNTAGSNQFLVRRLRPAIEGSFFNKLFEFKIVPAFDGGAASLLDAYLDIKLFPELALRGGKFKQPVGLERLQSISDNWFFELGYPTALVPNRDIGLQLSGDIAGGVFSYAVGVFNGTADGGSVDGDNNDGKDIAGRLFAQPFLKSSITPLQGLGLGVAATYGKQEGSTTTPNLPSYRSPGQLRVFQYINQASAAPPNVTIASGKVWRIVPQAYYFWGPFGFQGEYVRSTQELSNNNGSTELTHQAWQVSTAVVLTGEKKSYKGIKPKKVFNPKKGQWGALEAVARYQGLKIDSGAFGNFASSTASINKAQSFGGGLNWYLNENVKLVANYEHTVFSGGSTTGNRSSEHLIGTRLQLNF